MTIISGILRDGAGNTLSGSLCLRALRTTSNVIENTYIQTDIEDGEYSLNLQPCEYDVVLSINGYNKNHLGTIQILADTKNGTLNDLLINPNTGEQVTPEILQQIIEYRDQTKHYAETFDVSTLVRKSGDTMTGQLILSKNGLKINYDNKNIMALITADDNYSHVFYDAEKKQWLSKLVYNSTTNSWSFQHIDDVVINNKSVLKTGDYGIGALTGAQLENPDVALLGGCYATRTTSFPELQTNRNDSASLIVFPAFTKGWYVEKLAVVCSKTPRIYYRCATPEGKQSWYESITTANSTVDSNGFYKKASPIMRLFGGENINLADGFTQSGCGLVNDLAQGVFAKRIDVGHYEIHGSLGFAKEGWYITLPEDANGNKKFFAEYSVDDNNVITVKTYTKKFSTKLCEIVAGDPIDITDGRWIDLRLDMPEDVIEEEIIPSVLNPVITTEE